MPSMASGTVLFEKSGQAPSPSKDFHQLLVTDVHVVWRTWRISLRKDQISIPPSQRKVPHEDFEDDRLMTSDIARIFGTDVLNYVHGVLYHDWLVRMPDDIAIKIFSYLDLTDIAHLTRVCKYLRKLCSADSLWEVIYHKHIENVSDEHKALAAEMGWKKLLFTDRLQLQKQVSRLRRSAEEKNRDKKTK